MKTYRAPRIYVYVYLTKYINWRNVGKRGIIPGTSTVTGRLIVVDDQIEAADRTSTRGVRRAVPQDLPVVVEVESSYYYSISSYFTYSFFVGRGTGHRDGDQSVNASTRVREEARNWSKIRGYELLEPLVNGEDRTCEERIHRCSSIRY
ncbi:uncharacterized protein LOC116414857 [Apis florea]|uniref:uncharacterized protein LOC116414857 n=1 Tax=Apis florea TaxID=7463 RepID=UPI0012FE84A7|nr:uncharacterized protein LOC116414857 [Apis florea]